MRALTALLAFGILIGAALGLGYLSELAQNDFSFDTLGRSAAGFLVAWACAKGIACITRKTDSPQL